MQQLRKKPERLFAGEGFSAGSVLFVKTPTRCETPEKSSAQDNSEKADNGVLIIVKFRAGAEQCGVSAPRG